MRRSLPRPRRGKGFRAVHRRRIRSADLDWWRDLRLDLEHEPSGIASAGFEAASLAVYDGAERVGDEPGNHQQHAAQESEQAVDRGPGWSSMLGDRARNALDCRASLNAQQLRAEAQRRGALAYIDCVRHRPATRAG